MAQFFVIVRTPISPIFGILGILTFVNDLAHVGNDGAYPALVCTP